MVVPRRNPPVPVPAAIGRVHAAGHLSLNAAPRLTKFSLLSSVAVQPFWLDFSSVHHYLCLGLAP